ncbi:MAG: methyltransferase domain-containing protein [Clostridiaceae bacterium]|nr:methyltransferase domain-containing protein [Clostridiaceae bacterium]
MAYQTMKENKLDTREHFYVYPQLIKCYIVSLIYDKAEEICKEALEVFDDYIDLYYYLGKACGSQNKKKEAVQAFLKYLELLPKKDEIAIINSGLVNSDTLGFADTVYADLARMHYVMKEYDKCIHYAMQVKKSDVAEGTYKHLVTAFYKIDDLDGLVRYYRDKVLSCGDKAVIHSFVMAMEEKQEHIDSSKLSTLYSMLSDENDIYGKLNRLRVLLNGGNGEAIGGTVFKQQLEELATCFTDEWIPTYSGEILYLYIVSFTNISPVLAGMEEVRSNFLFEYLGNKHSNITEDIMKYLEKVQMDNTIADIRARKLLYKFALIFEKDIDKDIYFGVFSNYLKYGIKYVSMVFSKEFIEGKYFLGETSKENVFHILMNNAFNIKENNQLEYVRLLKKALEIFPYMSKGIGMLLSEIKEDNKEKDEYNKIREEVKQNIRQLLDNENIVDAKNLIEEYESLEKKDPEVYCFKGIISMMEGNPGNAAEQFEKGLDIDANNVDLLYNLGFCYMNTGNNKSAENCFKRVLALTNEDEVKSEIQALLAQLEPVHTSEVDVENVGLKDVSKAEVVKKLKMVFFVKQDMDSFVNSIISSLSEIYEVKKTIVSNYQQIDEGMEWADICWFEWCDELVVYGSKHKLAKDRKILCRLHSYEAFIHYPSQVHWNNIDKVIFVAEHIRDYVLERAVDLSMEKTVIIPNGIDLTKFTFKERKPGFNIAYVGYINYKKGPMLLLHTFKAICHRDSRYKLHIAGAFQDDRYLLYFNQMIREMELENNVIYHGWQSDINTWLEDKNYIISTSVLEGNPVGIMEAMARGIKPLIHNFVGSRAQFGPYVWNTINECIDMLVSKNYSSSEYYAYIKNRFSFEAQIDNIRKVIDEVKNVRSMDDSSGSKDAGTNPADCIEQSEVRQYYDNFLSYLKNDRERVNPRHTYLKNRLSQIIEPGSKVLDLGCGIGITTEHINSLNVSKLIGVDLSPKLIEHARKTVSGVDFIVHDITTFSLDDQFDVISLCDVMEHVPEDRYFDLFKVIRKHLKKSGQVFISIPDPDYLDDIRRKQPQLLQIIDNSIRYEHMKSYCEKNELRIHSFKKYSIFAENEYNEYVIKAM